MPTLIWFPYINKRFLSDLSRKAMLLKVKNKMMKYARESIEVFPRNLEKISST
jgi:hypothetical protein